MPARASARPSPRACSSTPPARGSRTVSTAGLGLEQPGRVRLVQGSHIVLPKLFDHDRAYIFQRPDGRIVFAIPYEGEFTLIGTTDRDYAGDPAEVSATPEEIAYLCEAASAAFARSVLPADVVWTYSGVRPLYDDGASEAKAASRDYVLEMDDKAGAAPVLSIIGGKITTYRRLAEAALERLAAHLPARQGLAAGWTGTTPLPGGEFDPDELPALTQRLVRSYPFLDAAHAARLVRAYGARAARVLGEAKSAADLGRHFGATLTEAEVRYLIDQEWAVTAEDVLWRRSKLGLHLIPRLRPPRSKPGCARRCLPCRAIGDFSLSPSFRGGSEEMPVPKSMGRLTPHAGAGMSAVARYRRRRRCTSARARGRAPPGRRAWRGSRPCRPRGTGGGPRRRHWR